MNIDLSQWADKGIATFIAALAVLGGGWLLKRYITKGDTERKEMLDRIVALEAKVDGLQEARLQESKEMISSLQSIGRACLSALTEVTSVIRYCQNGRRGDAPEVTTPDVDSDVFDISAAREAQCGSKSAWNKKVAK
jgi:hypothetical protein